MAAAAAERDAADDPRWYVFDVAAKMQAFPTAHQMLRQIGGKGRSECMHMTGITCVCWVTEFM